MQDLISRQAAIDVVRKCLVKEVTPAYRLIDKAEVMTELMMLPSAEPSYSCSHEKDAQPRMKEKRMKEKRMGTNYYYDS